MNISLDYDGTYTRDPATWDKVVALFRSAGHKVYVVTMRYSNNAEHKEVVDALAAKVDGVYFTNRLAKEKYMYEQGIRIDVWMDDMPGFVYMDGK